MRKEVMKQNRKEVESVIPSACLISSEDIADAIGLSHAEVCDDIELIVVEDLPRSGTIIVVTKEDLGGVGMDLVFFLDLEAVMEWTNEMQSDEQNDIRQAILARFLDLNSEGIKHYENLYRKKLSIVTKSRQYLRQVENSLLQIRDTAKALKKAIVKNNSQLMTTCDLPQVKVKY